MSKQTMTELCKKIATYSLHTNIDNVIIVIHGGEPLLASEEFYRHTKQMLDLHLKANDIYYSVTLQTNGTLLNETWRDFFAELGFDIGVSIDGSKSIHDENRITKNGSGTFDVIHSNLKRLNIGKLGLISVLNPNEEASVLYKMYKEFNADLVNTLLPLETYETFNKDDEAKLIRLLSELYFLWKEDKSDEKPLLLFFYTILGLKLGLYDGHEQMGVSKCGSLIVESNGDLETVDTLKSCKDGITLSNINLYSNEIEEIFTQSNINLYYHSHQHLCKTCKECSVSHICGGGYLPHRYSKLNGFNNPSVYCNLLKYIINMVGNDLLESSSSTLAESIESENAQRRSNQVFFADSELLESYRK